MARREYAGAAPVTTLAASIASGSLSFTVASGGGNGYPTGAVGPFFVVVDENTANEEKMLIANRAGDLFNVAGSGRGADGTQAVGHDAGATVRHIHTATDADEANAHVNSDSGVHGITGNVVGDSDPATLSNKNISGAANALSAIPQSAVTNLVADQATQDGRLTTAEADITALEAADVALDARLDVLEGTVQTMQVFTSSGTWTKPANLRAVRVRVAGGGGAGGGVSATAAGQVAEGGGGGGGGYAESIIPAASLGATETVTTGAGGTGSAGANGGNGGTSSFGTHVVAGGGTGGTNGAAGTGTNNVNAGVGGTASTGQIRSIGEDGHFGRIQAGSDGVSRTLKGRGGSSRLGSGGRCAFGISTAGSPGDNFGGGGSGAGNGASQSARSGGGGAQGVVIVENIF